MPTKPNYQGNQQNYDPKDGEYESGPKNAFSNFGNQEAEKKSHDTQVLGTEKVDNDNVIHTKGQYDIVGNKALWNENSLKSNWEGSQADKFAPKYAKSYKVTMTPKDFLTLAYRDNVEDLKVGDDIGGEPTRELNIDEFSKEGGKPLFLKIQFAEDGKEALVVGHEGRHRAFALMEAGIDGVDVELQVDTKKNYDKNNPYELDKLDLIGQFNKEHKATVEKPIAMSYENYSKLGEEDVDLETETLDSYEGQTDMIKTLKSNGKVIGYIQYSVYEDEPHIQMIHVDKEHRRKGLATKLLKSLQEDHPNKQVYFGMMTEEGKKLYENTTVTKKNPQFARTKNELEKLQKDYEKMNKTWDDIYEDRVQMSDEEIQTLNKKWITAYNRIEKLQNNLEKMQESKTYIK